MGIKVCFASVSYPRSNGQVERVNAEVLKGLKTKAFNKLENKGKNWIEHLPSVLWSLRTTPSRATGETPFFLVYGAEAVLPSELKYGSPRVLAYDENTQEERRIDDVNLLEEKRCRASLRSARYQQGLRRYHSRHVRSWELQPGDMVLRKRQNLEGLNKMSSKWEGPFRLTHTLKSGMVYLEDEQGWSEGNAWNIENLRKFYP